MHSLTGSAVHDDLRCPDNPFVLLYHDKISEYWFRFPANRPDRRDQRQKKSTVCGPVQTGAGYHDRIFYQGKIYGTEIDIPFVVRADMRYVCNNDPGRG